MRHLDEHTPPETSIAFVADDGVVTIGTYTGRHEPQLNNLTAYELRLPTRTVWVIGGAILD